MILHAVQIIINELNLHFKNVLTDNLPSPLNNTENLVELGSVAQIENNGGTIEGSLQDKILATIVNLREEKSLKNAPYYKVDTTKLRTDYFNPSVFLNIYLLFSATSKNYTRGISEISRVIRFFQHKNTFTQDTVNPLDGLIIPEYDQMQEFKIIMDMCSPTFEELNHLWGTLGGRQYPSVLYMVRLLELRHTELPTSGGGLIQEINRQYNPLTKFPSIKN